MSKTSWSEPLDIGTVCVFATASSISLPSSLQMWIFTVTATCSCCCCDHKKAGKKAKTDAGSDSRDLLLQLCWCGHSFVRNRTPLSRSKNRHRSRRLDTRWTTLLWLLNGFLWQSDAQSSQDSHVLPKVAAANLIGQLKCDRPVWLASAFSKCGRLKGVVQMKIIYNSTHEKGSRFIWQTASRVFRP